MAEIWGAAIGAAGAIGAAYLKSSGSSQSATPGVPYTPVDLQAQQQQAVSGNLANLPSINDLLSQSNDFQQQQATKLKNQSLPGYSQLASNLTGQATSLAANPYAIPQSVTDQLTQYAAEQNIGNGTGANSGFSGNNMLRSLGINALQYGQSNLASATNALGVLSGTAPSVSPMSPLSFLVSPAQSASNQQLTNTNNQEIAQGAQNSATNARNANATNLWDSLTSSVGGTEQAGSTIQSLLQKLLAPTPTQNGVMGG